MVKELYSGLLSLWSVCTYLGIYHFFNSGNFGKKQLEFIHLSLENDKNLGTYQFEFLTQPCLRKLAW